MQLQSQQIKIRELSEHYLRIEENTQYLTNIFKYASHQQTRLFHLNLRSHTIDLHSMCRLMVQSTYLLYTCYVKKVCIYISNDLYCFGQGSVQLAQKYCLQQEYINKNNHQQKQILDKNFIRYDLQKHLNAYGDYVINNLDRFLLLLKEYEKNTERIYTDKDIQRQLTALEVMVKKYLKPHLHAIKHPKAIIQCLQETQLFRTHSILLITMNNSLYYTIRFSQCSSSILKYFHELEQDLLIKAKSIKQITELVRELEIKIDRMMHVLLQQSLIQNVTDDQIKDKHNFCKIQGNTIQTRKIIWTINLKHKSFKPFTTQLYLSILKKCQKDISINFCNEEQEESEMQNSFLIQQYYPFEEIIEFICHKQLVCITCITNIEVNMFNSDLMLFQCNNISLNWNNISMILIQRPNNNNSINLSNKVQSKKKCKYLGIKSMFQLQGTEKSLMKILLNIDLVMACAKIIVPELRKSVFTLQDYKKLQPISAKINHIINFFIKKIDKVYK